MKPTLINVNNTLGLKHTKDQKPHRLRFKINVGTYVKVKQNIKIIG